MLKVFFGDMNEAIYDTATFFKHTYLDSWFEDALSVKMIQSVDRATVESSHAIFSKPLGAMITPTELSGGTKTLLLIHHMPNKVFNASTCGDNCTRWLLEIAKQHKEDILINLHHIPDFTVGRKSHDFEIYIMNTQETVHNMAEFVFSASILV